MKFRLKLRLSKPGITTEKIAFDLSEKKWFPISAKTEGLQDFGTIDPFCRLKITRTPGENGLWVHGKNDATEVVYKNQSGYQFLVKEGDQVVVEKDITIEFLMIPEITPQEEPQTRFIEAVTRLIHLPPPETQKQTPFVPEPTITPPLEPLSLEETPIQKESHSVEKMDLEKTPRQPKPFNDTPPIHTATHSFSPKKKSKLSSTANSQLKKITENIGVSSALIALFSELSFRIAIHAFPIQHTVTPFGKAGCAGLVLGMALAFGIQFLNPFFRTTGTVVHYLRTLATLSVLSVLWASSFHFSSDIIIIIASTLMTIAWSILFIIQYQPIQFRFLPISCTLCVILFVASYRGINQFQPKLSPPMRSETPLSSPSREILSVENPAPPVLPISTPPPLQPQTTQQNVTDTPLSPPPAAHIVQSPLESKEKIRARAKTNFFSAVRSGNLKLIKRLVDSQAVNPRSTFDHKSSALHYAAKNGNLSIVKYFISKKININSQDSHGNTPLMLAIYKKHLSVVTYLLKQHANIQTQREDGMTAFKLAKATRNKSLMRLMTQAKNKQKHKHHTSSHHPKKHSRKHHYDADE